MLEDQTDQMHQALQYSISGILHDFSCVTLVKKEAGYPEVMPSHQMTARTRTCMPSDDSSRSCLLFHKVSSTYSTTPYPTTI